MIKKKFDRTKEDVGNIIKLEHLNLCVEDQLTATVFYVQGLGFTRDPYMMTSINNMWINLGRSQFHLPTGKPQVLRGRTGLVVSSHKSLIDRLKFVRKQLSGTKFRYSANSEKKFVDVWCPYGNRFRCHEAGSFGNMRVGMPYIQFDVQTGSVKSILNFYRKTMHAPGKLAKWDGMKAAIIQAGNDQVLVFREQSGTVEKYDGHHIQIYVTNFSGPYKKLQKHNLVSQETNEYQYRFVNIIDLDSEDLLFKLDHEVRSMSHPLYGRHLINRDPDQTIRGFVDGYEAAPWLQLNKR